MSVVFPAPDTPMRQVRRPGRKAPLMSYSSVSCGRDAPSTQLALARMPLQHDALQRARPGLRCRLCCRAQLSVCDSLSEPLTDCGSNSAALMRCTPS